MELKSPGLIIGLRITNLNKTNSTAEITKGGINHTEAYINFIAPIGEDINSRIEIYGAKKNGALAIRLSTIILISSIGVFYSMN